MNRRSCSLKVWRVCQNLSAQHLVHALGCLLLHVGQDVGVGVHLLPYVGVPKHLLNPQDEAIRRAPQDGRPAVLRFRALLTENGVERVELARA
jgi:hypothetical protein